VSLISSARYINKAILCRTNDVDHTSEEVLTSLDEEIKNCLSADVTELRKWRTKTKYYIGILCNI